MIIHQVKNMKKLRSQSMTGEGLDIKEVTEKEQNQRKKEDIIEQKELEMKKVITLEKVMKKMKIMIVLIKKGQKLLTISEIMKKENIPEKVGELIIVTKNRKDQLIKKNKKLD